MAIQNKSLSGAEHDWYATRSGMPTEAPLNEHKIAYFASKGFGSNASLSIPVTQLEEEWLHSVAGRACEGPYDLWSGACEAQSVTVGKSVDECKFNFFTSVASGTNP
jgi:hypothetical protein